MESSLRSWVEKHPALPRVPACQPPMSVPWAWVAAVRMVSLRGDVDWIEAGRPFGDVNDQRRGPFGPQAKVMVIARAWLVAAQ